MSNEDIGDVLYEVAELLDIQNGNRYRANAFRRSARLISSLREPVADQLKFGRLQQKPGIGSGTVERVKQILRSGTFDELERLRAQVPSGLRQLTQLKGIGPKTAKAIWQQLRISTVPELEHALLFGHIDVIPGMGAKTKEKIVDAIRYSREDLGRILLPEALAIGTRMIAQLRELREVVRIEQCGSARRRRATIGDLDILVGADDKRAVAERFCTLPGVVDVLLRGEGRCSVRIERAVQVDLRVVAPETFGAGMHYFTGSQQHNIRVRTRANAKGWSVNEHGVFVRAPGRISKGGGGASEQRIAWGTHEQDIFSAVALQFVPPELRENEGEIEAAERGRLPVLVDDRDLLGDLHVRASPQVAATLRAQKAKGRRWAVVVHPALKTPSDVSQFAAEIDRVAHAVGMTLLPGAEVAIGPDGAVPPRLDGVRWVVAQIPEHEVVPGNDVTERLLRAVSSGAIDALARPTGRVLLAHKGHRLDFERVLRAMVKHHVVLEVRGHPLALDPDAATIRRALELGVMLSLTAAPSTPDDVEGRFSALCEARRGWATARNVLECARLEDAVAHQPTLPKRSASTTLHAASEPNALGAAETPLDEEILQALTTPPASPALAQRALAFVARGEDPEFEASLERLRPNVPSLSTAFALAATADDDVDDPTPKAAPPPSGVSTPGPKRRSVLDGFGADLDDDSTDGDAEPAPSPPASSTTAPPATESAATDHKDVPTDEEFATWVKAAVEGGAVDARLRGHLDAFVRGETRGALGDILARHSQNPLQLAFELVMRA